MPVKVIWVLILFIVNGDEIKWTYVDTHKSLTACAQRGPSRLLNWDNVSHGRTGFACIPIPPEELEL